MSRATLENEISNLKSINAAQSLKIEDYEQKMYELKRQLATAKAMEEHLSSEIESVQINDKSENDELLKKISALEEEIHSEKQKNADTVQYYETKLQKKNSELDNVMENIKSKSESNAESIKDEIIKYADEIYDLKLKIEELTEQLLDSKTKYQEITLKNHKLENQIIEQSRQLNEFKECLEVKKEELEESKELSRNLQDDMIIMQLELDKFKSLPMEKAAKGNSLFAEVDDNRVKLQKTMEIMKKKYLDMRTRYSSKCQELQNIRLEFAAALKIIENKNDSSDDKADLAQTYESYIQRLTENIQWLENELDVQKQAFTKLISKDWKCAQEMVTATRKEVLMLQNKLRLESLCQITNESNHYKTKRELKKLEAEATQLRTQALILNQTINDLKLLKSPNDLKLLKSPPIATTELNLVQKSCLKHKPPPMFTDAEWDDDEYMLEYSILKPKFIDANCSSIVTGKLEANNANYNETKFLDEFQPKKNSHTNEENNKENEPEVETTNDIKEESKENITLNNTLDLLSSKFKKVYFEDPIEPQKTNTSKLGGRKIIKSEPIHIPSIKRN